jgi:hypothetical protein
LRWRQGGATQLIQAKIELKGTPAIFLQLSTPVKALDAHREKKKEAKKQPRRISS